MYSRVHFLYVLMLCKKNLKASVTLWEVPIQGDVFQWAKIELWAPFRL